MFVSYGARCLNVSYTIDPMPAPSFAMFQLLIIRVSAVAERARSDLNGHLSDTRNATSSGSSNGDYPSAAPCMIVHNDGHNSHNGWSPESSWTLFRPTNEELSSTSYAAAYFPGQANWERDLNNIKLEYMDLDDFLQENNRGSVRGPHQSGQLQQHLQQHRQQMQMSYARNSNEDLGMRFANAKPRGEANAYPGRATGVFHSAHILLLRHFPTDCYPGATSYVVQFVSSLLSAGYCNVQSMEEHYSKDTKSPESPNQLVNVECGFTRNDLALATIPGMPWFRRADLDSHREYIKSICCDRNFRGLHTGRLAWGD